MFLGISLIVGFYIGKAAHWVKLTALIGYISAGILLGPVTGLVELSPEVARFIVDLTLSFVAFLIGVEFSRDFIKHMGEVVIKVITM